MASRCTVHRSVLCAIVALLAGVASTPATAQSRTRPPSTASHLTSLESGIAAAERSLRDGEFEIAESRYRAVVMQGWMLVGSLEIANANLAQARDAFHAASMAVVQADAALQSLGIVQLETAQASEAVGTFTQLVSRHKDDIQLKALLASALAATGSAGEGVQELDEARRMIASTDAESRFLLASAYLRLKRPAQAAELFNEVTRLRPGAATYVLIGRTYRDFDQFKPARAMLTKALTVDPRVRRAHYYLGTLALQEEGLLRVTDAIAEYRAELTLAPDDPLTNLRLGMSLVEARDSAAALPHLESAMRSKPVPADAFYYMGRCQLALGRVDVAAATLREALALAEVPPVDDKRLGRVHYQLALALRRLGAEAEAAPHFAAAETSSATETNAQRESLRRYLVEAPTGSTATVQAIEHSGFAPVPPEEREATIKRARTAVARAYFNIGIMHAQQKRLARAADYLARAAAADPDLPDVQYSLGVAQFNAQRYKDAVAPLARAVEIGSHAAEARRMLALAYLNADDYENAARLLVEDPGRDTDPSLQYAYGLALVRSNHPREAEAVFNALIGTHEDSAELNVLMGQAYAQQGDMESALKYLQRAVQLKPDVPEANTTAGIIYLKQGKLDEAVTALQSQLKATPADTTAEHALATALDLQGKPDEAIPLLRSALDRKPDFADARYLLGKILVAKGDAGEAAEHLEAAARIAPEDANIHFQLAQAYRKLGRQELAAKEFQIYQQIKDKRRGKSE